MKPSRSPSGNKRMNYAKLKRKLSPLESEDQQTEEDKALQNYEKFYGL